MFSSPVTTWSIVLQLLLLAITSTASDTTAIVGKDKAETEREVSGTTMFYSRVLVAVDVFSYPDIPIANKETLDEYLLLELEPLHDIGQLKDYFTWFLQAVNRRFEWSDTTKPFRLEHVLQGGIRLVNFHLLGGSEAGDASYDAFQQVLSQLRMSRRKKSDDYDVAILFTNKISSNEKNIQSPLDPHRATYVVDGASYKQDQIHIKNFLVVEDDLKEFGAVVSVARALASLYGCPLDGHGDSGAKCSSHQSYIMGDQDQFSPNNVLFSTCSIKFLEKKIQWLHSSSTRFLNRPDDNTNLIRTLYPGLMVPTYLDQCNAYFREKFDSIESGDTDKCKSFLCVNSNSKKKMAAYDGTPCDKQKICWRSRCTSVGTVKKQKPDAKGVLYRE